MIGIDPNNNGFSVLLIKGIDFSDYKPLAYFYVSWVLVILEMLIVYKCHLKKSIKWPNN